MSSMNLPNRLSLLRILLVPAVVALMETACYPWALAVFCLASVTDFVDGRLARGRGQVTALGKFLDPVADKMLVLSTLVCLTARGVVPAWFTALLLARDLAVDGLRLAAAGQGRVSAAALPGKIKTALQMLLIILGIVSLFAFIPPLLLQILIFCTAGATVWSGILIFLDLKDSLKG